MDQSGQVLDDNDGLSQLLLRRGGLVERSGHDGHQQRQSGSGDLGNKGDHGQSLDTRGHLLGVAQSVDNELDSGRNILVIEDSHQLHQGLLTLLSKLGLEVVETVGQGGDTSQELDLNDVGGAQLNDSLDQLESSDLGLPLGSRVEESEELLEENGSSALLGDSATYGIDGSLGGSLDRVLLVGEQIKGHVQGLNKVTLNGGVGLGSKLLGHGGDERNGALSRKSVLLVLGQSRNALHQLEVGGILGGVDQINDGVDAFLDLANGLGVLDGLHVGDHGRVNLVDRPLQRRHGGGGG